MVHILRFERPGQRFAPHERLRGEARYKHLNLHLHLRLSFRVRQKHFSQPGVVRVTRIFAALVGASAMAITLFRERYLNGVYGAQYTSHFNTLAVIVVLGGLVLAWSAAVLASLPLLVSAIRSKPRARVLLAILLAVLCLVPLLLVPGSPLHISLAQIFARPVYAFSRMSLPLPINAIVSLVLGWLGAYYPIIILGFYIYPLICTTLFNRAIRQTTIADKWLRFARKLSFVMVGGMALALLGGILWGVSLLLLAPTLSLAADTWFTAGDPWYAWSAWLDYPWYSWLPFVLGMLIAFIVAARTLLARPRSRDHGEARPHNASPSDIASSHETREYTG
jgi:hypothetical protein